MSASSEKRVRATLTRLYGLKERRFMGDYGACDALIDLARAIGHAELTERQEQVIRLVYVEDMRQEDAAQRLGITQDVISRHLSAAVRKISIADREED